MGNISSQDTIDYYIRVDAYGNIHPDDSCKLDDVPNSQYIFHKIKAYTTLVLSTSYKPRQTVYIENLCIQITYDHKARYDRITQPTSTVIDNDDDGSRGTNGSTRFRTPAPVIKSH
ncbi:hypothetical protein HDU86_007577 [Geranomyces michiganensis]|nr:hypothetical protein HDU86_007577 [Geranomyces michiganensis]